MFGVLDVEVNPFGPVQLQVAPVTVGVLKFSVAPSHKGPLLLAVGVDGVALTITVVDPAALVQPFTVTVTLYVPASVGSTLAMFGVLDVEVNPFGPVQLQVAPVTVGVLKFSVAPSHKGPLLLAVGVAGVALTTTVVEPTALVQPLTVTVTLYVPASVGSTFAMFGVLDVEVNPFGPVQLYVAPVTVGVLKLSVAPSHKGPLLVAVGVAGVALTITVVDPAALVQPLTVTVTLYVPASVGSTFAMLGVLDVEVKPLGPVQLQVAPVTVGVLKFNVAPVHKGPLLVAVGVAGNGLTTTVVDPAALVHPFTVMVTEYVPASAMVTLVITGVLDVDVNPLGPVQL